MYSVQGAIAGNPPSPTKLVFNVGPFPTPTLYELERSKQDNQLLATINHMKDLQVKFDNFSLPANVR